MPREYRCPDPECYHSDLPLAFAELKFGKPSPTKCVCPECGLFFGREELHISSEGTPEMPEREQPIQPEFKEQMNKIGRAIDTAFNPDPSNKKTAFALFIFPFGQPNNEHRSNYISNAQRQDIIATLKEFIARVEGTFVEPNGTHKV